MVDDKDFVVAIELGSSRISGVAGRRCPDGSFEVLAFAEEKDSACIQKGAVFNIEKTGKCVKSIIDQLGSTLGCSISQVYVGVSGKSLRTVRNRISRTLEPETVVTNDIVDNLLDTNLNTGYHDQSILHVISQEYKVGQSFTMEPVGVPCGQIDGDFLNIIANNKLISLIEDSFRSEGIKVVGELIAPLELANGVLTDNEKRSGCVLVDFGAQTTTVSIYKNNVLRHLAVIPLGGNNITKDLCDLGMEQDEAERVKIKSASAYTDMSEIKGDDVVTVTAERTVSRADLIDIVEARMEEILDNVSEQISVAGHNADSLIGGMVVTGGASNISNLAAAIEERIKINKVRFAKTVTNSIKGKIPALSAKDGVYCTLISLMMAGKENCAAAPIVEEVVETPAEEKKEKETPATSDVDKTEGEQVAAAAATGSNEEKESGKKDPKKPGGWSKFVSGFTKMLDALTGDED
jgi:cell division protein FtsA